MHRADCFVASLLAMTTVRNSNDRLRAHHIVPQTRQNHRRIRHRQAGDVRPAARLRHQEGVRQSRLDRIAVPERLARRHRLCARPAGGLRGRHGRRLRPGDAQRRFRQSAFRRRRRQRARQYLHRAPQPDAAGDHRGPAGALILPLQAFLYAERASEFPRPYVKYCVEPARAEDVPAAIARAYYVAMQPPCGPTFVSVPIDDWTHPTQPIEARQVSRELGPDPDAMKALVAALSASKHPALVVGPGVDRAGAVESDGARSRRRQRPRSGSARSRRAARFPERHPQFAGFLHASPAQLSDALARA